MDEYDKYLKNIDAWILNLNNTDEKNKNYYISEAQKIIDDFDTDTKNFTDVQKTLLQIKLTELQTKLQEKKDELSIGGGGGAAAGGGGGVFSSGGGAAAGGGVGGGADDDDVAYNTVLNAALAASMAASVAASKATAAKSAFKKTIDALNANNTTDAEGFANNAATDLPAASDAFAKARNEATKVKNISFKDNNTIKAARASIKVNDVLNKADDAKVSFSTVNIAADAARMAVNQGIDEAFEKVVTDVENAAAAAENAAAAAESAAGDAAAAEDAVLTADVNSRIASEALNILNVVGFSSARAQDAANRAQGAAVRASMAVSGPGDVSAWRSGSSGGGGGGPAAGGDSWTGDGDMSAAFDTKKKKIELINEIVKSVMLLDRVFSTAEDATVKYLNDIINFSNINIYRLFINDKAKIEDETIKTRFKGIYKLNLDGEENEEMKIHFTFVKAVNIYVEYAKDVIAIKVYNQEKAGEFGYLLKSASEKVGELTKISEDSVNEDEMEEAYKSLFYATKAVIYYYTALLQQHFKGVLSEENYGQIKKNTEGDFSLDSKSRIRELITSSLELSNYIAQSVIDEDKKQRTASRRAVSKSLAEEGSTLRGTGAVDEDEQTIPIPRPYYSDYEEQTFSSTPALIFRTVYVQQPPRFKTTVSPAASPPKQKRKASPKRRNKK